MNKNAKLVRCVVIPLERNIIKRSRKWWPLNRTSLWLGIVGSLVLKTGNTRLWLASIGIIAICLLVIDTFVAAFKKATENHKSGHGG